MGLRDSKSPPPDTPSRSVRASSWRMLVALLATMVLAVACSGNGGTGDTDATTGGSDAPATTNAPDDTTAPDGTAGEGDGGSSTGPTTLVVSHPQEPPNWDYTQTGATAAVVPIGYNVLEPLLDKQEDGTLEPLVAESYEVSEDGLEYIFNIREATFHDGSELDSADVVYSLETNKASAIAGVSASLAVVDSIEAPDERTVVVTLSRPSQGFLVGMSERAGMVIPEGSQEELAAGPIGSGPYVFGEWRPDVDLTLERYDDYWGTLPHFEEITFRFMPNETAALAALETGEIDMIATVIGEGVARLSEFEEQDGFALTLNTARPLSYLGLNSKVEVFDDERIRQAIAHALDRESIMQAAISGWGETTCTYVNPPNEPWNSDYCPYPYDPERSRELLAEAGAENLTLDYKYLTIAEFPPIMEVVVANMADVGITLEIEGFELATYLETVNAEPFDYEVTSLTGQAVIDEWVCPGRASQVCDDTFDSLIADADAATDRDEWIDLRRQAVEYHADMAYVIPVFTKYNPTLHRADLEGIKPFRVFGEFDFRDLAWTE